MAKPLTLPAILIADDDELFRSLLARFLQPLYRVVTAGDGAEALERIRAERPALVLQDINMPRMDGVALLRSIRATAETRSLPVIILLATGSLEDLAEIRKLQPAHIIPKEEVSLARIRELVREHIPSDEHA